MRVWRIVLNVLMAMLSVASASAQSLDASSAKAFVNSVFKLYPNHGKGIPLDARYLHPALLALIRADLSAAKAASEVPWPLDADIMCDCQEWDGIFVHKIESKLLDPSRSTVTATFDFHAPQNRPVGDSRSMRYTLVATNGQWRVYDIEEINPKIDNKTPRSLLKRLQKDISDIKHHRE